MDKDYTSDIMPQRRRPRVAYYNTQVYRELDKINENNCVTLYDPCTKQKLDKLDPVSGKEDYDIKVLEKRIKYIKKIRDTNPVSLYNLNNKTSNYDFLMNVFCNKNISLDDMVSFRLQEGGQIGSDIYEVLCRLFVIFGGVENVNISNGDFKIMLKIENSSSVLDDLGDALKNMECKATSKMGVSDITLIRTKSTGKTIKPDSPYCEIECDIKDSDEIKTYLMSVKWYQKEKSAEHYDLEKLFIAGENLISQEKFPFSIIVFLKSKLEFQKAHRRSYRQYVSRIAQTFFGWNEDVKPFLEDIRKTLFQNTEILKKTPQELIISQFIKPSSKPILSLQLHQDLIVTGINDLIQNNPYNDNKYVIGVLPRGGKTFIAGGTIREFMNRNNFDSKKMNILWITAAPNETRAQVENELILRFTDFQDFNFVNVKDFTDFQSKREKPHTLWFCSIQLLTQTKAGRAKGRPFLDKLTQGKDENDKINLIFFDEAHAGGAGFENKKIIDELITTYSNNTPFIFLTATYLSIVVEYKILKSNLFIWDYTDVLKTRALGTESERESSLYNLKLRFGEELVTRIVNRRLDNTDSYEAMARPYMDFPELYFISSDFNEEAISRFAAQDVYNPNKGFSLKAIFGLRPDYNNFKIKTADGKIRKDAYKIFANLENPRNLISLLTPSDPTQTFNFEASGGQPFKVDSEYEQTLLKRIEKISNQTGSRFRIDEYPTLLMFLPTGGQGSDISKLLPAFASLLMAHDWWNKRYEVACVITDFDKNPTDESLATAIAKNDVPSLNIRIIDKNLKSELLSYERELHCRPEGNKKGLIILAGERLSMGISLPCTDCVFLLNEVKSPDDIIQKMYRALTPSIDKKSSFVIDLNPLRSLSAVYGYTRAAYESAMTNSSIIDIIYETYSWDEDIINLKLEKGGSKQIDSSQQKLRQMLEEASRDKEYSTIFKNVGDLERKLSVNITKKIEEFKLLPVIRNIILNKISKNSGISFNDKSKIEVQKGQLILRTKKEKKSPDEGENKEEEKVDDIVLIENFSEAISDFIKYLAMTSTHSTLNSAVSEFESNLQNETGKSLQSDVVKLLESRQTIKPFIYSSTTSKAFTNPLSYNLIIKLFIDVVRNYSPNTSREIFRQMKSKIDEPSTRKNEVLKIIHRHLTPKKSQKEQHGEVFTPIELIEKMLNKLPKSTWSNPDLKFLDPANGIGNFPIVAFYKLNEGLTTIMPNETKRKKHIIENMLYMIEIQSNNTRIARNIFTKLCSGCKPNIWTYDSLNITPEKLKEHGWPENYNIVMGNPPYQTGGTHQSGITIWPKFITKFITMTSKDGYLIFVNGQSWRGLDEVSKEAREIIRNHNLIYTNILGNAFKGINFPVDFFVLKNNNKYQITDVHNELLNLSASVDINKLQVIPNYAWNVFERWEKNKLPTLTVMRTYDTTSSKKIFGLSQSDKYKYPIIMNITSKGLNIKYSEKAHDLQNKIKVLVAFGSSLYPYVDKDGKYGVSENVFAIVCSSVSEANVLAKYLNEPIVKCLINALKIGGYAVGNKLLSLLPNPANFSSNNLHTNLLLTKSDVEFLTKCSDLTVEVAEISSDKTSGGEIKRKFNKTRKNKNK